MMHMRIILFCIICIVYQTVYAGFVIRPNPVVYDYAHTQSILPKVNNQILYVITNNQKFVAVPWYSDMLIAIMPKQGKNIVQVTDNNNVYTGQIIGHHVATDITCIKIDTSYDVLKRSKNIAIGTPCFIVHPEKNYIISSFVSAVDRVIFPEKNDKWFKNPIICHQAYGIFTKDFLGAPVVNSNAELLGILYHLVHTNNEAICPLGHCYMLPASYIDKIVTIAQQPQQQTSFGMYLLPYKRLHAAQYYMYKKKQIPADEFLIVLKVEKKSSAEKVGLKPGDIIIGFNGEKITNANDVLEKLMFLDTAKAIKITIIRKNQIEPIDINLDSMKNR